MRRERRYAVLKLIVFLIKKMVFLASHWAGLSSGVRAHRWHRRVRGRGVVRGRRRRGRRSYAPSLFTACRKVNKHKRTDRKTENIFTRS